MYHIREQHDAKIYLEHTTGEGIRDELTYYQSDIVKALKENKIEMIDKRELVENKITNHDIIKMWADEPKEVKKQFKRNIMDTTEQKSVQGWDDYQFDLNQSLTTKDVYAFLGKGGTPESISQKISELSGREIVIPRYIKNQDLWNTIVKPFRELPQVKQSELKNYLVSFLEEQKKQIEQKKAKETPKEKFENFANYYTNEYEIRADKNLNKHDILAFFLQYGKGAQKKLLELTENFLGHSVTLEKREGEEFEIKIINPILEKGIFASTEFKNILIENLESQKIFREQSQLEELKSTFLFCEKEKKVYAIEPKDTQIEVKGVSMLQENTFEKTFDTIEAFNEWKDSIEATSIKKHNYEIGDEFVFKMEGIQNIFTLIEKNEHKGNSLLDSFIFKTGEEEEAKQDRLYRIDVEILIGQNKAKQVTPEMKAKGILLDRDYKQFHLDHLKGINPNTGLTDKNIYAIMNVKMGDVSSESRKNLLEKYFNTPFDELKKFRKDQMIEKIYAIKKGENKNAEFELKSEIQKLFLQSKGETNSIAPEPYQKYLGELSYPEKGVWELEHIDKLLTEENDILALIENTPLENDKMCSNILEQFTDDREFILHSPSFHTGVEQIEAKQYLLNAINHSEDKELIKNQLLENIQDNEQKQTYQLKR